MTEVMTVSESEVNLPEDWNQKRYETWLKALENRYEEVPRFLDIFKSIDRVLQMKFMQVESCFIPRMFISYVLVMRNLDFPEISIMETASTRALHKKLAQKIELKVARNSVVSKDLMIAFGAHQRRSSGSQRRGLTTLLHILAAIYGEDAVREILNRMKEEIPEATIIDAVQILPYWDEVREHPLSWALSLYSESVTTREVSK